MALPLEDATTVVRPEPTLSFTQGLMVGQFSVVIVLAVFIRFFIFGDAPSPEETAAQRATERRSRTLSHKKSLLSVRSGTAGSTAGPTRAEPSLNRKKSSVLRGQTTLTIGSILSKTYYKADNHQPESLDWFNVLVAQMIAQLRSDAQHDNAILDSLTKALNGGSRPDFLDEIKVTELSLGEDFPIFSNCRIIPVDEDGIVMANTKSLDASVASRDGPRLQARLDIDLSDMLTLALETKILINYPKKLSAVLPVALAVSVTRFSGTLSISFIPSNRAQQTPTMMTFNFLDDYRLDLSIRSLLGSRSRLQDVPKIAQLIESRLHRWFDERCVEPRFQEIPLPSMWPRKKNTRGPEDSHVADNASVGSSAAATAGSAAGRARGPDIPRGVQDEARKEVEAEMDARSSDIAQERDALRMRRRRGVDD
ncbi:hypothetical protein TD95_001592 [Thielaviopsis punctulata]|uniref:Maintenance of mitochondrial morphology protein 1 n=1 Tax=Thielaviopsis punctulata TaxID=72032 RepID=A0A0F4ZHA6_9PEZI|nr:hypothetical protein TD95_001592 [Thielaviopsis punctulata]